MGAWHGRGRGGWRPYRRRLALAASLTPALFRRERELGRAVLCGVGLLGRLALAARLRLVAVLVAFAAARLGACGGWVGWQ